MEECFSATFFVCILIPIASETLFILTECTHKSPHSVLAITPGSKPVRAPPGFCLLLQFAKRESRPSCRVIAFWRLTLWLCLLDFERSDAFDGLQDFLIWYIFRIDDEVGGPAPFLLRDFPVSENGFLRYRLPDFLTTH